MNSKLMRNILIASLLLAGEVWAKSSSFPMTKPYLKADAVLVSLSNDAPVPFNKNVWPVTLSPDPAQDTTGLLWVNQGWLAVKKISYFPLENPQEIPSAMSLVIDASQDQRDQLAKLSHSQNKSPGMDTPSPTAFVLYLKMSVAAEYSIQAIQQESVTELCSFLASRPAPTAPLIRKKYAMASKLLKANPPFYDNKPFDSLAWNFVRELITAQGTITLQDFRAIGVEATWDKNGTSLDAILDTDGRGHYSDDLFLEQKSGELVLTHSEWYRNAGKIEQTQNVRRVFPNAKLLSLFTPTPTPPARLDWAKAQQAIPFPKRQNHAALVFKNKLWVIGGYVEPGGKGNLLDDVWSSEDGLTWTKTTGSDSFPARSGHTALVYDHRMWILGGTDQNTFYNDAWSSSDGVVWTKAPSTVPYPSCSDHASVVFRGKMWILGGVGGKDRHDEIWTSTDGASWSKVEAKTPFPKSSPYYGLTYRNKIWLFNKGAARSGSITIWNSSDGSNWNPLKIENIFPSNSMGYTVAVYKGMIWLVGAEFTTDAPSFAYYSNDGADWTLADTDSHFTTRDNFYSSVFKGHLWILGGEKAWATLSDVWYSQ